MTQEVMKFHITIDGRGNEADVNIRVQEGEHSWRIYGWTIANAGTLTEVLESIPKYFDELRNKKPV